MNWSIFIQNHYCYQYLIDQIPFSLLLYSHIPTAIVALVFGVYIYAVDRKLASFNLLVVCVAFGLWSAGDLVTWFAFLGTKTMMFMWSWLDLVNVIFFAFTYYFLYVFLKKSDLPDWQKAVGILIILPVAVTTLLGLNIISYDATICEATERDLIVNYSYLAEGVFLLASLVFGVRQYIKSTEKNEKRRILFSVAGVTLFLGFFLSASLAVAFLINYDIGQYAYNYLIYGLFGMPILLGYLGYLIVRYRAFDVRIFAAQALVFALVAVIGSEFAFLTSDTNRILVSITLVLTGIVGIQLIRGVRREIEQRQHIEKLARDLEAANEQQVNLIHFITHQIKGFVTKSRNIFSMALEGDFGEVNGQLKPVLQEGFDSDTRGSEMIAQILNAANIRLGKVEYHLAPLDERTLVQDAFNLLKPAAEKKSIELTLALPEQAMNISGDKEQLGNVFRNLIDNSIKYTPSGNVSIALEKKSDKILFSVKDTGVGITPEDMKVMFTEGGHGKDSVKVNVESTGYGLYIVKQIVEGHKGRVWVESEGQGKGSQFYVELPAA